MAHGLESRVPFLDNDLVDFAMRCPVHLKLNNLADVVRLNENEAGGKSDKYFQRTKDGKQILRDVMGKYIPQDIAKAEKQGFSAPDASWFKGESMDFVKKAVQNENSPMYAVLDRGCINSLIGEHLAGASNKRLLIWSVLNFNTWLGQQNVN